LSCGETSQVFNICHFVFHWSIDKHTESVQVREFPVCAESWGSGSKDWSKEVSTVLNRWCNIVNLISKVSCCGFSGEVCN
jgi:hypothetical protein